ncbi:MAG: bifunctional UDP-N-acetylglucosamine diphosphorylase/glucosamine-1-phosphate N-acetyltransferase GlmU [Actinomycetota bacterium]|nr:bifunctional UDP-N-acetylglucosamine diphosphorylase/glucosamine-1-phosphate N-acetyltransferase GlmU [Actinomycetota bacterium]
MTQSSPATQASPSRLAAVVLAAGEGTRMKSSVPKVLHPLCGRPMLLHVIGALEQLSVERIVVVVGHAADKVIKTLHGETDAPLEFVEQRIQRGTGDAVSVALTVFADELDGEDDIVVVPGDTPLLRAETVASLVHQHEESGAAATILTARLPDATGYGRIVRGKDGGVESIVDHWDATPAEREIDEVNTSIYCFRRNLIAPALRRLSPENAQGEYYLTDAIAVLRQAGHKVMAMTAPETAEALGVNDRLQLAEAEAALRLRINASWMRAGVTMTDPSRTYVDASVTLGADVSLLPGVVLEGRTTVGPGSVIGPDTRLVDTVVGEGSTVTYTVAREAEIGDGVTVGPYTHLRPGTRLGKDSKAGSFVEIKATEVEEGAKVPHLAYMGDATVGAGANVGAGTITANYDGRTKHRTRIGARAHIGSNTVLVAPVEVGDDAYTGAGSVVTRDVPAGALAKGVPARVEEGWVKARGEAAPPEAGGAPADARSEGS